MRNPVARALPNLIVARLLSSIWVVLCAGAVWAHEVVPTIADLTIEGGEVRLEMRVNIEAQLSGIDLDTVADTDEAENAADYDALRALSDAALSARTADLLPNWNGLPVLAADGTAVALTLADVSVPAVPDEELPRVSTVTLTAMLETAPEVVSVQWPKGAGDFILRQQGVPEPFTGLIAGGNTSGPIAVAGGDAPGGWDSFLTYIPVGFDHILPQGLDHILFVLGLFFLSTRWAPLLWQVSAFTLAHTVTLGLGAAGLVNVPGSIVEPLIAASIVYVAVENIFARDMGRVRVLIVFGFGLLHGLGFASVLGEYGLPEGAFLPALVGFNIGVELGQLTVIALAALALWLGCRAAGMARLGGGEQVVEEYPIMFRAWSMTGSVIIALIAVYWVIERVFL